MTKPCRGVRSGRTTERGGSHQVVEIFGLSCAGKSTLVAGIVSALQVRADEFRLVDIDPGDRSLDRARAVAAGYTNVDFLLWALVNPRVALSPRARAFAYVIAKARELHAHVGAGQIVLLDEGPLKRYATLAEGSRRPDLLYRSMPSPDLAVNVVCSFPVRLDRMRSNGRPHARGRTDEELLANHVFRSRWNRRIAAARGPDGLVVDTTRAQDASLLAAGVVEEILRRCER
ncbi:hypothetical protein [Cellulosimicrobium protaetiae]|uniref:Uncharacterized protein n=1 Tax=Cellulosimicrobium protaetiae TaxID=2587808 RepID=A0A6M5UBW5_9MICO|nr:hypothetical protein [Cellulosimicrobium protaetiae]QJW35977.1 hypothetical protein FIC82_006975 [Cellulosimicrobium protaetiae]